jgi:hypothetical protein
MLSILCAANKDHYTQHLAHYDVHLRHLAILSKVIPPVLTAVTIGLEYTPTVQSSWVAYMFVANVQAVTACTLSIFLIAMILWKYVDTKRLWRNVTNGPMLNGSSVSWKAWVLKKLTSRNSSSTSEQTPAWARDNVPKALADNNWLVMRLSFAIVFIS